MKKKEKWRKEKGGRRREKKGEYVKKEVKEGKKVDEKEKGRESR